VGKNRKTLRKLKEAPGLSNEEAAIKLAELNSLFEHSGNTASASLPTRPDAEVKQLLDQTIELDKQNS
jgi:hypothetical protein